MGAETRKDSIEVEILKKWHRSSDCIWKITEWFWRHDWQWPQTCARERYVYKNRLHARNKKTRSPPPKIENGGKKNGRKNKTRVCERGRSGAEDTVWRRGMRPRAAAIPRRRVRPARPFAAAVAPRNDIIFYIIFPPPTQWTRLRAARFKVCRPFLTETRLCMAAAQCLRANAL